MLYKIPGMGGVYEMATVFDYLDWRGDLSFSAVGLCEADNLIFSLLSYLDFSGLVLEQDAVGLPLRDIAPLYFNLRPRKKGALGLLLSDEILDLLEKAALTPRFGAVRLWAHRSRLDEERELQFSATSFALGNGSTFVAFRGTDDTLTGWKEDFNMAVCCPVPAQEEARAYLEFVSRKTADRLILGGHSKGGNLAVYAAAFSAPEIQQRIDAVWCNDGPGFLPEMLNSPGFQAVRTRIHALLPRSSVVGVLLSHDWEISVIASSAVGALQHNALTWQVLGPDFVRVEGLSRSSRQVDKTFHTLLLELSPTQRRQVIDDVFSVGKELGVRTLSELVADGRRRDALRAVSARLTGLEKDARESMFRALKAALRLGDDEDLL